MNTRAVHVVGIKNADQIRQAFYGLLTKANKEGPQPKDVQALKDLLYQKKDMRLWKAVVGMLRSELRATNETPQGN